MRNFIFILIAAVALNLNAATYYVDFDGGDDSNAGTSTGTAWKHSPGDVNATSMADSTSLVAGDTVVFKGGVVYRGAVVVAWNGDDGNRIIFDGNTVGTWGTGRAIMDGSDVISTSWTPCADAADCGGNTNFANIYYTTIPAGVSNGWPHLLYNGTNQTHTAQDPNPSDRFLWDNTEDYFAANETNVTTTSLRDTSYFTQASSTYWNEAWLGMRESGNSMEFRLITGFNTSTDTVTVDTFAPYDDRDTLWSVFNHPALIDQPGEHAVNTNANRLYLWPPGSVHPTNYTLSIATRKYGFYGTTKRNIEIRGFLVQGYYVGLNDGSEGGSAVTLINTSSPGDGNGRNNKFLNNEVRYMKSMIRRSLVTLNQDSGMEASFNYLHRSYAGGIRMARGVLIAKSNTIDRITGTGIFFQLATNSFVSWNTISNLVGTHANGLSVYTDSKTVEISYNRVVNANNLITYEDSADYNFIGNYVDSVGKDQRINEWSGMSGYVRWIGNTIVNNSEDRIFELAPNTGSTATYYLHNNIIDGGGVYAVTNVIRTHNIYTGRHFWQNSGDGWELGLNETDETEADLFVTPGSDWRLKTGSPAIDEGTNGSAFYNITIDGQAITGTYDIGAFGTEEAFIPTIVTNNASGARVMGFRGLGMSVLPLPASSLLVDESFEGAGTPAGWTASGTPDFDNTSSPIGGAQDLLFSAGSDRRAYTSFSESGEVWIRLRLKMSAAPSSTPGIVFIQDAVSASAYVSLQVHTSRTLRLIDNSGANTGYTTDAVTAGTDVYVFIHIAKGTGSDAVFDLEWSTTSTRTGSGNKYVSASNGAYAVNSDYIDIYRNDSAWSTSTFQIDDVKVSNTGWPQ